MKSYSFLDYEIEQRKKEAKRERKKQNEEHKQLTSEQLNSMFRLIGSFDFTVPKNYNHGTSLTSFKESLYGSEYEAHFYCHEMTTDENFSNVSHCLMPEKSYLVKLFGIPEKGKNVLASVLASDCLDLYAANKAYLVGAQGISTIWGQRKLREMDVFENKVKYYSLDKKQNLPFGAGFISEWFNPSHVVPYVYFEVEWRWREGLDDDYEYCHRVDYFQCHDFDGEYISNRDVLILFCDK